jgi:hypothetical protein
MSTVRLATTRIDPAKRHAAEVRRRGLALAAACAVIFAAAFVLGRSGGSTSTAPHEGVQWVVPQASVGTAVPARLTTAPPIEIETPPPPPHPSSQAAAGSSGRTSSTVGQSLTTPAPVEHSSSSGGASAPKSGSSGGEATHTSQPGQSFETSG